MNSNLCYTNGSHMFLTGACITKINKFDTVVTLSTKTDIFWNTWALFNKVKETAILHSAISNFLRRSK